MRAVLLVAVLLAGCATKPAPDTARIETLVDDYLAAHIKADRTKTHASGEHPMAMQKAMRCEQELTRLAGDAAAAAAVRSVIADRDARAAKEIEDAKQRRIQIDIQGRALAADELAEKDALATRIREAEFKRAALADLRDKIR
jgi:hypothetical protein